MVLIDGGGGGGVKKIMKLGGAVPMHLSLTAGILMIG